MRRLLRWIAALAIAVGVYVASMFKDAASTALKEKLGFSDMTATVATFLLPVAVLLAFAYFVVWAIKRQLAIEPEFVLVRIVRNESRSPTIYQLLVTNKGAFFEGHLVKLTQLRQASDGADSIESPVMPLVLQTTSQFAQNRSGRFALGKDEEKHVILCHQDKNSGCLRIDYEGNHSWTLLNNDGSGFVRDRRHVWKKHFRIQFLYFDFE